MVCLSYTLAKNIHALAMNGSSVLVLEKGSFLDRMSEEIIRPRKRKAEPSLGPIAVMVAMEQDLAVIRRMMGVKERSACSIVTSRLYRTRYHDQDVSIVGPVLGAPHGVMILEKLNVLGAKTILFLGWCGSLQQGIQNGDLVVPDRGVVGEGTSKYYPINDQCPRPSSRSMAALEDSLREFPATFHKGPVWSTDAPYRETKDRVLSFQKQGVLGVDMELSALLTVGRFRAIEIGALLVVSDELGTLRWKPGFSSAKFKRSRKIGSEVVCATCLKIAHHDQSDPKRR
jgi:uridine phosphorylase